MNDQIKRGALRWLWLSIFVIVLDQVVKQWALHHLILNKPVVILPVFNLFLAFNKGAAFSFLAKTGSFALIFFGGLAVVICAVILVWLARLPSHKHWLACGLSLVLGGAIGNLMDRVFHGYVVDFIQLHIHQYYWPTFNTADTAITIGAIIILMDILFFSKKSVKEINEHQ